MTCLVVIDVSVIGHFIAFIPGNYSSFRHTSTIA